LSGNKIVLDSGSAIPCSLNANNKLVELDTMIPVNAATGKRNLRIAYLASQAPQSDFDLSAPPSDGTLTIRRFNENDAAGTVLSAADFTLKNSRIHLASPLVAGQKIVVSYEFLPDLGSGCFVLTGKVAKSSTYRVRYGAPDHAEPLDASKYTVTENSAKDEKICLKKEILDYGMQIEVDYVAVVFN
jgi:hypothetical protein